MLIEPSVIILRWTGKVMARTRDKEKPAQIIEAAFSVFGEIGYESTVMKDIAERAGISSGTIYTYFNDKRDLFRATAQEGWNRFLKQIREIAESAEPAGVRVLRVIDVGFRNLKDSLPLLRGMLFESSQMRILQHSLLELCRLLDRMFEDRPRDAPNGWRTVNSWPTVFNIPPDPTRCKRKKRLV